MSNVLWPLYYGHWTLHTEQCTATLYTTLCTLQSAHCGHCTQHTVQWTPFTLHTTLWTLYTKPCTIIADCRQQYGECIHEGHCWETRKEPCCGADRRQYAPFWSPSQPISQHRPRGAHKDEEATQCWTSWPALNKGRVKQPATLLRTSRHLML